MALSRLQALAITAVSGAIAGGGVAAFMSEDQNAYGAPSLFGALGSMTLGGAGILYGAAAFSPWTRPLQPAGPPGSFVGPLALGLGSAYGAYLGVRALRN